MIRQSFLLRFAALLAIAVLSSPANATNRLNAATIKGTKFFDSTTGDEIVLKGIDYYPRPNSGPFNRNSVDYFTEEFRSSWERDLVELQELGVNAVRLYSVDPQQNHDAFMCALNKAGIYVIVELASDCPTCAILRDKAPDCYPPELKWRGQAVIQEFAKYSNTLAFSTGNEVNQVVAKPEWNAPCQKRFLRDMRAYMARCSSSIRHIPIGLVAADAMREENALYYNCRSDPKDEYENAEWYGLNSYVFCNHNITSYEDAEGFRALAKDFGQEYQYSIPVVLTEFGCLSSSFETVDGYEGQRDFLQAQWLLTEPSLRDTFAGGFVFEYSTEMQNAIADTPFPFETWGPQNYGTGYFSPEDCDDVGIPCEFQQMPNFLNLQKVYNEALPYELENIDTYQVPSDKKGRTKCPKQFPPLSRYKWKADKLKNMDCPILSKESNFTCPNNLDELRGRYELNNYVLHRKTMKISKAAIFICIVTMLAVVCYLYMREKETEAEITELMQIQGLFKRQKAESVGISDDGSDESTGLLSMQDLAGFASSKSPYQSIDSHNA